MEGQIEEVQQVVEIELEDKEVTPDEIAWDDSEGDVVNGDAPMSGDPEVDTAKTWAEADCRVVVNVSTVLKALVGSFLIPARCSNIRAYTSRSYRMGPILYASSYCIRPTLLYRTWPHGRGHPSSSPRHHRRIDQA